MTPETVEETTEGGLPIRDLFAFAGVRKIIGDPHGKLMQDEVADRIQKLVNVLQNVVGLVDALEVLNGTHKGTANTAMRRARMMIIETVEESMPEWDVVLEQIHEANDPHQPRGEAELAGCDGSQFSPHQQKDTK